MAGAKGVIISIIGGEDMKLLEVDEAANHIRELVDEDANIIWGSAFNPDLQGKIRVSVVATGIEQSGSAAAAPTRSFSMSESRAPQRPVLDLPSESVTDDEPFELSEGLSAEPEEDVLDTMAEDEGISSLGLSSASADDFGDEDEEDDDVDGIVDPLAGLRNEETERFDSYEDDDLPSPADDTGFGDGWTDDGDGAAGSPLDLSDPLDGEAGQDELQLGADQYADGQSPLASKPGRKQAILGGGAGGGGGDTGGGAPASQGSTLFERMANLSRGSSQSESDDDDDGDEDEGSSGSLNIPRFLGRQNNQ